MRNTYTGPRLPDDSGRQMRQRSLYPKGFTLFKLMVSLGIVSLLAAAALPSLAGYVANSQLREAANVVLANALWARSEAIKLNATTTLTLSDGMLQITSTDRLAPAVLRTVPLSGQVQSADFRASFDSAGQLATFGTERTLSLSSTKYACSQDVPCPVVRFDAGGTVSVCATGTCP